MNILGQLVNIHSADHVDHIVALWLTAQIAGKNMDKLDNAIDIDQQRMLST